MRKLLIPLLAAIALPTAVEANWFGKYGSYREAKEACNEWRNSIDYYYVDSKNWHITDKYIGKIYKKLDSPFKVYIKKGWQARECQHEEKTNQILGIGLKGFNPKLVHKEEDFKNAKKHVLKYFKY